MRVLGRWTRAAGPWLILAAFGLFLLGSWLAAVAAAGWLVQVGQAPEPSDLMVVVAGGADERLVTAGALYRRGFAPRILMTDLPGSRGERSRRLAQEGVPPDRMVGCPAPVSSTRGDAACIRDVAAGMGARSLLVVTSPYHCRRLSLILRRTMPRTGMKLTFVPSTSLYWKPRDWWRHPDGWEVPAEMIKLVWAWATVPDGADVRSGGVREPGTP
jgi:uncharacterized SAM-binding protein YcdF (DUF218 family)